MTTPPRTMSVLGVSTVLALGAVLAMGSCEVPIPRLFAPEAETARSAPVPDAQTREHRNAEQLAPVGRKPSHRRSIAEGYQRRNSLQSARQAPPAQTARPENPAATPRGAVPLTRHPRFGLRPRLGETRLRRSRPSRDRTLTPGSLAVRASNALRASDRPSSRAKLDRALAVGIAPAT